MELRLEVNIYVRLYGAACVRIGPNLYNKVYFIISRYYNRNTSEEGQDTDELRSNW